MTTLLLLIALASLAMGPVVIKNRNSKFAGSDQAKAAQEKTKTFAQTALAAGETVILSDYSPGMKAHVLLTDRGVHYLQEKRRGDVRFDAAYADIKKCDFLDFSANKVKATGNVMNIRIAAQGGKCTLYQFPKAGQIAQELACRGFGK